MAVTQHHSHITWHSYISSCKLQLAEICTAAILNVGMVMWEWCCEFYHSTLVHVLCRPVSSLHLFEIIFVLATCIIFAGTAAYVNNCNTWCDRTTHCVGTDVDVACYTSIAILLSSIMSNSSMCSVIRGSTDIASQQWQLCWSVVVTGKSH